MGHRTKEFCYCDGCGLEQFVTGTIVPDKWVTVTLQEHGKKNQHYCPTCWSVGFIAINDAATLRLKKLRGDA